MGILKALGLAPSERDKKLTELVTLKLDEEIKKAKELNSNR